ncbi:hypothetical protein [Nostoc sp.]|uniref:hypothetical protein n=1 Tax=Nostoc sp. TaxID=1180 RepID=UPI002FFAB84E
MAVQLPDNYRLFLCARCFPHNTLAPLHQVRYFQKIYHRYRGRVQGAVGRNMQEQINTKEKFAQAYRNAVEQIIKNNSRKNRLLL